MAGWRRDRCHSDGGDRIRRLAVLAGGGIVVVSRQGIGRGDVPPSSSGVKILSMHLVPFLRHDIGTPPPCGIQKMTMLPPPPFPVASAKVSVLCSTIVGTYDPTSSIVLLRGKKSPSRLPSSSRPKEEIIFLSFPSRRIRYLGGFPVSPKILYDIPPIEHRFPVIIFRGSPRRLR